MDKEAGVQAHKAVLPRHERMEGCHFQPWGRARDEHTSEVSETERQVSHVITSGWNPNMDTTNFFTKQKQLHRLSKETHGYQKTNRGVQGEIIRLRITHIHYYLEKSPQGPTGSTRKPTQQSVINSMGKETKKNIYVYK